MGFWVFMTGCNLILPILMVAIGKVFVKNPPRKVNRVYGYRTHRSMKNQDTWNFAHLYCGKLWWKAGWVMLPLSIVSMIPVVGKSDDIVGGVGVVVEAVECVVLLVTIFFVERALGEKG